MFSIRNKGSEPFCSVFESYSEIREIRGQSPFVQYLKVTQLTLDFKGSDPLTPDPLTLCGHRSMLVRYLKLRLRDAKRA